MKLYQLLTELKKTHRVNPHDVESKITEAQTKHPDINKRMLIFLRALRQIVRRSEGYCTGTAGCSQTSEYLDEKFGWPRECGTYLSKTMEPLGDHCWNFLSDGSILDVTADQFKEPSYYGIKIITPDNPEYYRYRLEWHEDYHPGGPHPDLEQTEPLQDDPLFKGQLDWDLWDKHRAERKKRWWLQKKYQKSSVPENWQELIKNDPSRPWGNPKYFSQYRGSIWNKRATLKQKPWESDEIFALVKRVFGESGNSNRIEQALAKAESRVVTENRIEYPILFGMEDAVEQVMHDQKMSDGGESKLEFNIQVYGDPYPTEEDEDHRYNDEWLRDWAEEKVNDAASRIEGGLQQNPDTGDLIIYRRIDAPANWPSQILAKNIGIFWAWDARMADAHWSKGGTPYLVTGEVAPEHVDWASSLSLNVSMEEEGEIRLYDETPVKLIDISVRGRPVSSPYKPVPSIFYPRGQIMQASIGESIDTIFKNTLFEITQDELEYFRKIQGEKDPIAFQDRDLKLGRWLEDNGWEQIGSEGTAYSIVYGKESSSWVIKILKSPLPMKEEFHLRCGLKWLRLSQKYNHSNPHLPKVAFVKSFVAPEARSTMDAYSTSPGRTYVAVIERLEELMGSKKSIHEKGYRGNVILDAYHAASIYKLEISSYGGVYDGRMEAVLKVLDAYPEYKKQVLSWHNELPTPEVFDRHSFRDKVFMLSNKAKYSDFIPIIMDEAFKDAVKAKFPLAEAVNMAIGLEMRDGCLNDFHAGNVMVRPSTGQLVITDPTRG